MVDEFHQANWIRRFELSGSFADPRLRTLSRRLVYCEALDVIPVDMRKAYACALASRICARTETTGKWLALEEAIENGNELILGGSSEQGRLLHGYLERLLAWRKDAHQMLQDAAAD